MKCYSILLLAISFTVLQTACSQSLPTSSPAAKSMFFSNDAGVTWQPWKSDLPDSLHVSFIEAFGERTVIATETDAMYISDASGDNWQHIGAKLPSHKINALSVSNFMIYAALYREGVYRSVDAGASWESLNDGLDNKRLMAVLKISDRLLVAGDDGIFVKMDGEDSWRQVFDGGQAVSLQYDDGVLVAGATTGVLISHDLGETWESIHRAGAIHNTAIFDSTVVAMYIDNGLFVSHDLGKTWITSTYSPRLSSYVYDVSFIDSTMIMSNNYGIHRSVDRGKTWRLTYPTEELLFFDFLIRQDKIFAGMRVRKEFRD